MDTFGGDEEDPLSLHKYLYCQADPIDHSDPGGQWSSVSAAPIHQTAIDDVLSFLPETDRSELRHQQELVDEHQEASESYMHAMRDGEADVMHDGMTSETELVARQNANFFVRKHILASRRQRHASASSQDATTSARYRAKAMVELGQALHTLQDSTSPAHHGFKPWYNYPGGRLNLNEWRHGLAEAVNPGPGSWLYRATAIAYDYYNSDTQLPQDFFANLGGDTVGAELSGLKTRIVRAIPQWSANFIWSQLSLPGM